MDVFGSIRACGGSNLDLLRDAGPFFHDAIVKIDEVKRFWPAQSVERPVLSAKASKQVVRGMDYAEVDAPLVRIALVSIQDHVESGELVVIPSVLRRFAGVIECGQ